MLDKWKLVKDITIYCINSRPLLKLYAYKIFFAFISQ